MSKLINIQKILIPIDFSETSLLALEHGVFMAKLVSAEIILLHVVESHSFASSITAAFGKAQTDYESNIAGSATEKLKEMADKIHHQNGNAVSFRVEKGKIYRKIIGVAEDIKASLIIMGTHGASGFEEFVVGSNASKVVNGSPCPVISVQTHAKKIGFHDIVIPIDNSPTSRQKVKYAIEIARLYKSVIHVAGFMTMKDIEMQRIFELKVHKVCDYIGEHEVAFTSKMFKGDAITGTLLDYSTQINADLVVILTDQEGSGIFAGSGAHQIVNHSKIPIMSIKPYEGDPDKISVGY